MVYQVMRVLLRLGVVDVNAKNYQGLTTLDLVMRLPSHEDNGKAVSVLPRRAKTGSSITQTPLADYLSSFMSFHDNMGVVGDYLETGISDQIRNAALVVAALIVAAAYQGVLNLPGIVSSQTPFPITLNITNANTTSPGVRLDVLEAHQPYNISKSELRQRDIAYIDFMLPNCCALVASLGMIFLLLPVRSSTVLIHLSLLYLMLTSWEILATTDYFQPNLKVGTWISAVSIVVVVVLVPWMKIASLRQRLLMKRLLVRDRRLTL